MTVQLAERISASKVARELGIPDNTLSGWVYLPSQRDADDYEMMSDITDTVKNSRKHEQLIIALSGRGAFRRFKDAVIREGIADAWYAFRDLQYLKFARDWCEYREIPYDQSELPNNEPDDEQQTGIFIGKTASSTVIVTEQNTAKAVGSGSLDVFATPMMVALMWSMSSPVRSELQSQLRQKVKSGAAFTNASLSMRSASWQKQERGHDVNGCRVNS